MSHAVLETLGWVLLHLLWQGALVAAGLALALLAVGRRAASARYLLACGALALMLALPLATGWQRLASAPSSLPAAEVMNSARAHAALPPRLERAAAPLEATLSRAAPTPALMLDRARDFLGEHMPWLVLAWGLGVIASSLRLLSGWLRLRRLVREAQPTPPEWQAALERLSQRLRLPRAVRLLQTAALEVPAAVGWLRPVVLLPVSALTGLPAKQLEMVLAHELAHVLRYDFAVNMVQALVETLLFYHPAVWWISRVIREEREHCCDDIAVRSSGNAISYARALTALEALRVPAFPHQASPAMSALGGSLTERVRRLVGVPAGPASARCLPVASVLTLVGGLAVAAPLAALGFATPSAALPGTGPKTVAASGPTGGDDARPSAVTPPARNPVVAAAPAAAPAVRPNPNPNPNPHPQPDADDDRDDDDDDKDSTRVDGGKLTVDQLVSLKVAGITPERVAQLEALGYEPTVSNLVQLGHAEMTPEYVQQMTAALGQKPSPKELLKMKTMGVTPETVQAMKSAGYSNLSPHELAEAAALDVTPAFIRELSSAGYDKLPFKQLTRLRAVGVDGRYVSELAAAGYAKLPAHELEQLRALEVDAAYIKSLKDAGFDKLSPDDLEQLRAVGVNADFIRKLREQGLENLTVHDLVRLRTTDVDGDFIRNLRKPRK